MVYACLEARHAIEQFPELMHDLHIEVLDIPDDYAFMNPELMALIREHVESLLNESSL